ncbi:hypothetical protein PAHAL_5G214100 [Panicum hallii]|uniref:Uncharacterized protein n=1 Tax=Panicum hallii TaxID=206008 RepID=A0A2T8IKR3_9POAL|nr:hypothetical protein PAHAL_5G214100 [Panicum hallii]
MIVTRNYFLFETETPWLQATSNQFTANNQRKICISHVLLTTLIMASKSKVPNRVKDWKNCEEEDKVNMYTVRRQN